MVDLDSFRTSVCEHGFAIAEGVLTKAEADEVLSDLSTANLNRSRAGARHILKHPCVSRVANDLRMLALTKAALGESAFPFRATLFDKSPESNWLVVWHQDTALPLQKKLLESLGWGSWPVKDGISYVDARAAALEKSVALRIHLDDATESESTVHVLPTTLGGRVLTDGELQELESSISAVACTIAKGGVLAMLPLIAGASSKSQSQLPRRVLHIEYAAV